jgi:ornithine cyclodeaminase/alanine dehydrogenase-like protein (mu-crystallin family)
VPDLLRGRHFVGIGSFRPAMQELPDPVFKSAGMALLDLFLAAALVRSARLKRAGQDIAL